MKVSLNWLKNYIDLDVSLDDIIEKLTLAGIEVEEVIPMGNDFNNVIVGKVVDKQKHPDADKLSVCMVDVGEENPLQIVCGAPNVEKGMTVPVAVVGAVLPGDFKIKKAKLRGVASSGMICSQKELGLGEDHSGIWDLGELNAGNGTSLKEALDLESDTVLDLFITPNRPDCLSVIGIARELAAVFALELRKPDVKIPETGMNINDLAKVTVHAASGNPRYAARVIQNVKIGPSPAWMQHYLNAAGMRPINNIVDITNFVMLELGQPLHAFDYDHLEGHEINVRYSTRGEQFITLDDKSHHLPEETVLICDGKKPVALGGIMGGQNSEISPQTTNILLESAYFSPLAIRSHAKKMDISTESSQRFEKGVDPNGTVFALDRAAALMGELAGGEIAKGAIDVYPDAILPQAIRLREQKIKQILGIEIDTDTIKKFFTSIGIDFDGETAIAPTFRPDLTREIDLIEEIARLYGLDNIPGKDKVEIQYDFKVNEMSAFMDSLNTFLSARRLFEVNTNSMMSQRELLGDDAGNAVEILNPLSDDLRFMRTHMAGSLLKVCAHNQNRQVSDIQIFETGKIFRKVKDKKYVENWQLAVLLSGSIFPEQWGLPAKKTDLFYLKGLIEDLMAFLKINNLSYTPGDDVLFTSEQLQIKSGKQRLGNFGLVKKDILKTFGIHDAVYIAHFDIRKLFELQNRLPQYQTVSKFPSIRKDLALVVDEKISAEELDKFIRQNGGEHLQQIEVFDVFTGKHLKAGEKSIAFKLLFQNSERTLTEEEVNDRFERIIDLTIKNFNAHLRGR